MKGSLREWNDERALVPSIEASLRVVPSSRERRLTPSELRRRLWHMLPGLVPFFFMGLLEVVNLPLRVRTYLTLGLAPIFLAVLFAVSGSISRPGERTMRASILGYVLPIVFMLLLFPARPELGFTVWVVLAFGDGSATLMGLLLDSGRLPWNPSKSWAGFLSFGLVAGLLTTVLYDQMAHVSWGSAAIYGMSISFLSSIVESLPSRVNDNPRVGITAAVLALLGRALLS